LGKAQAKLCELTGEQMHIVSEYDLINRRSRQVAQVVLKGINNHPPRFGILTADEHPGMEGLNIMAKSETTPVPVVRELLPIKTPTVTVDCRNFRTKDVIVDMPDDLGPQNLNDNPKLWRIVQASRGKALNALDRVTLVWFDKIATAIVDCADSNEVVLTKMTIMQRRERDRVPWRSPDGQYEIRPISGKWSWFRTSDNVQMGGLRENWEAARANCRQHTGIRVA
jgi:hypothetical protein